MTRRRLLFAITLSCLSGFCAESSIGSGLWLFYKPFYLLVTIPIYALHILVLTRIITRKGAPPFYVLYAAGAILGLYEAYITKMIFVHTWGQDQLLALGVSWFALPLLVFWYHPLFAFIIPLFIMELVVVGNRKGQALIPELLRSWVREKPYRLPVIFGTVIGLYHGINPDPWNAVGAVIADGLFILLLVHWARRFFDKGPDGIVEWIPRRRAFVVLTVLLLGYFALFGYALRPEALPGLAGYVTVLVCYVYFGVMVWRGLSESRVGEFEEYEPPLLELKHFRCAVFIWMAIVLLFALLPPVVGLSTFVLNTVIGYLGSFAMLAWWSWVAFRRRRIL